MASSMNILGTYSGITMETIEQMIQAESGKVVKYTNDQKKIQSEQSAWKDVQTRLSNLTTKLNELLKPEAYAAKKVSSSNEEKVAISAGASALEGQYEVTVEQVAARTQVTGSALNLNGKKLTEALGFSGTFTLSSQYTNSDMEEEEGKTIEIQVTEESSMKDIVNAINEQSKESGITAVIIDKNLVLQDKKYGDRTITMTDKEGNLSKELGMENPQIKNGQPSILTVNGISMTRNTNTITDVIEGITIETKGRTSDIVKVGVEEDTEQSVETIKSFIEQYNSTLAFINEQLSVGDPSAENNKTGSLAGDSSLLRLQTQLRNLLTYPIENDNKKVLNMKDIGITVDRYGVANLDSKKLETALKENNKEVQNMFHFTKTTSLSDDGGMAVEKKEDVGLSQKFLELLNAYTDSKEGIIATKNETYDKLIKDLNQRIDIFNEKLEAKRQRYIETFTALDVAMMEAESQMNYLASQIGMNGSNNK